MPDQRAILTYHSLDRSGSIVSLAPERFRRQMRSLFERGIRTVTPLELAESPRPEGSRPGVALTFDDGFENFYSEAFPVLAEFRLSATVFLVTGSVGDAAGWARQPSAYRDRELLSWSRIEELGRAGVRFGAHSMTHPDLTKLPFAEARREITESKKRIEDRIGAEVEAFAYPYGAESAELRKVVAEHFAVGCSTRFGCLRPDSPRESLERLDVYYLRNLFWYRRLFRRSTGAYLALRGLLRSWRENLPRGA